MARLTARSTVGQWIREDDWKFRILISCCRRIFRGRLIWIRHDSGAIESSQDTDHDPFDVTLIRCICLSDRQCDAYAAMRPVSKRDSDWLYIWTPMSEGIEVVRVIAKRLRITTRHNHVQHHVITSLE